MREVFYVHDGVHITKEKMEAKLAKFRASKAKEKDSSGGVASPFQSVARLLQKQSPANFEASEAMHNSDHPSNIPTGTIVGTNRPLRYDHSRRTGDDNDPTDNRISLVERITQSMTGTAVLKLLLWLLLWCLFIELGFGAVYFVVSMLFAIYFSTRTSSSRGLSAYSVFNPNYERIDGTFTAEQFEKELKYGAGSVH